VAGAGLLAAAALSAEGMAPPVAAELPARAAASAWTAAARGLFSALVSDDEFVELMLTVAAAAAAFCCFAFRLLFNLIRLCTKIRNGTFGF